MSYFLLYEEISNECTPVVLGKQKRETVLPELFRETQRAKTDNKNYNQMVMNLHEINDDSFSQKVKDLIVES